jgi:hypothetical protein
MDFSAAFWLPIGLLFATAIITAIIRFKTRDPCVKVFDGSEVWMRLPQQWHAGRLDLCGNAGDLIYTKPELVDGTQRLSRAVFSEGFDLALFLGRRAPLPGSVEEAAWLAEIRRIRHPSLMRRLGRKIRNFFNMIRDAFSQTLTVLIGAFAKTNQRTREITGSDQRLNEIGQSVLGTVPNAFEPLLEHYIGHRVLVETKQPQGVLWLDGVLEEYSSRFLLLRDAPIPETPGDTDPNPQRRWDVVLGRNLSFVRHRITDESRGQIANPVVAPGAPSQTPPPPKS